MKLAFEILTLSSLYGPNSDDEKMLKSGRGYFYTIESIGGVGSPKQNDQRKYLWYKRKGGGRIFPTLIECSGLVELCARATYTHIHHSRTPRQKICNAETFSKQSCLRIANYAIFFFLSITCTWELTNTWQPKSKRCGRRDDCRWDICKYLSWSRM